jgi:hypothetical protein
MSLFYEIEKNQPGVNEKYEKFLKGELAIRAFDSDLGEYFLFKYKDDIALFFSHGWDFHENSFCISDDELFILKSFISHTNSFEINVEKYIELCKDLLDKGISIKKGDSEYFIKNGKFYLKWPITCFSYLIYDDITLLNNKDIIPVILNKLYGEKLK